MQPTLSLQPTTVHLFYFKIKMFSLQHPLSSTNWPLYNAAPLRNGDYNGVIIGLQCNNGFSALLTEYNHSNKLLGL
jgi:hypothetical protein